MNPAVCNLSISALIAATFDGCSGHCFWRTGVMSGQVSMRCSTIEGSMPGISVYDQAKISKRALYVVISSGVQETPIMISSTMPGLMEMSILMVGEMLARLPSSKASGAGMGLLNQSIVPDGIKSLVSTA
jgi:hypothetical protein